MAEAGFEGEANFRQVGTRTAGKLLVGTTNTHQVAPKPSAASIPSKFETILYSGDTEVDGFASRVARFKPGNDDRPGAGEYHKQPSMVYNHDSISKKGYGNGFVSKTDRFFYVSKQGAPAYFPGPGAYKSTDYLTQKNQNNYNRAEITSNFQKKESAPLVPPNREVPGPGEYMPDKLERKRRSRRERVPVGHSQHRYNKDHGYGPQKGKINKRIESESNNSFGRVDTRFKSDETDVPPAGAYNPDGPPGAMWATNDHPSASFKSGSERNYMEKNLFTVDNPGPAHYNPNEKEERSRTEEDAAGHCVFKKGQIDRFGRPLVRRKPLDNFPGPGTYEAPEGFGQNPYDNDQLDVKRPPMTGNAKGGYTNATRKRYGGAVPMPTTASISASLQHDNLALKNIRPPGPAYYKPDAVGNVKQRSFLLNMGQKWV